MSGIVGQATMLFSLEGFSSQTGRAVHKDGSKLPTAGDGAQLKKPQHGDKAIDRRDIPRLCRPRAGVVVPVRRSVGENDNAGIADE
jgi:hypothetical protein